ncbi:OLC1v1001642C1 [Oldenlandia corymbosa var. corymbosa]|uniref:Dirigent protein n=1 Tax=Oldenlandia corymbosa var. corymbosa TaxID=529605 RepID=A0AAV1D5N7_OLDCO|nr:OLC1v1001642C1 [Oldenlandia corymbosa var. corymbosa]
MASSTKFKLYTPLILALIITVSRAELREMKETSMTLYFQELYVGANATVIQITTDQDQEGHLSFTKFGTMFCTDDPITEEFEVTSVQVARAQGIYVTSALDGSRTHVLISIVFENGDYKGSTLEVQGSSAQFDKVREVAVVGGTGKLRFARGYATFETIHLNLAAGRGVIQCNITVQHY